MKLDRFIPWKNWFVGRILVETKTPSGIDLHLPIGDRFLDVLKTGDMCEKVEAGMRVLVDPAQRPIELQFKDENDKDIRCLYYNEYAIMAHYDKPEKDEHIWMEYPPGYAGKPIPKREPENVIDNEGIEKGGFLKESIEMDKNPNFIDD